MAALRYFCVSPVIAEDSDRRAPTLRLIMSNYLEAGGRRQEVEGRMKYFRQKTWFLWLGAKVLINQ